MNGMEPVKSLVLVVDDEPGILRFVKAALVSEGFDVVATGDGRKALDIANSGEPDIMVLDIYMEPMSGFDVLRELRTFSHLPVVAISARREAAEMAMKEGANGCVAKPFAPGELARKIRDVLDEIVDSD